MRIAYFLESFPKLSETFVLRQICASLGAGHDVFIFPVAERFDDAEHPEVRQRDLRARVFTPANKRGLPEYVSLHTPRRSRAALAPALAKLIRHRGRLAVRQLVAHTMAFPKLKFDVIHAHFGPSARRAALLIELGWLQGPLVSTFHGFDVHVLMRRYPSSIYAPVFERSAAITVGSRFMYEKLAWMGAPRAKLQVLPMGIPLDDFQPRPRPTGVDPLDDRPVRFATLGRITEVKGLDVTLAALARINDEDWHLDVIGDGPLLSEIQTQARALRIDKRVTFHGQLPSPRVRKVLADCDVLLHAARQGSDGATESQGVALAEAHALGLPIVSTRSGGISETVLHGETGFLAAPNDVDSFAAALHELLDARARWPALGEAGRLHIEKNFNLKALNAELMSLYEQVAGDA